MCTLHLLRARCIAMCAGALVVALLGAVLTPGCQVEPRATGPGIDRLVPGPFLVHAAYTDGQRILGRSAPRLLDVPLAREVVLLEPAGAVEGLSMTFFKNRRIVAWLGDDGTIRAGFVPGTIASTVIVEDRQTDGPFTRPGLTASADRIYLTTTIAGSGTAIAIGNQFRVYDSTDGVTWRGPTVVPLSFTAGSSDAVFAGGRLWAAVTSRDLAGTDTAMLMHINLTSSGGFPLTEPTFFPVAGLPPLIEGARGVRLASDGTSFAVACVSPGVATLSGLALRSHGMFAISDPVDTSDPKLPRVTWGRGGFVPLLHGVIPCPTAMIFEHPPAGALSGPLGLGFAWLSDGENTVLVAQQGTVAVEPQRTVARSLKDIAVTAGRELMNLQDVTSITRPPNQ